MVVRAAAVREAGLEVAVPREGLVAKVVLAVGKGVGVAAGVVVSHVARCVRREGWSNVSSPGSRPYSQAVAYAMAKRPQSRKPFCLGTWMC